MLYVYNRSYSVLINLSKFINEYLLIFKIYVFEYSHGCCFLCSIRNTAKYYKITPVLYYL